MSRACGAHMTWMAMHARREAVKEVYTRDKKGPDSPVVSQVIAAMLLCLMCD